MGVERFNLGLHPFEHFAGVFAFAHDHNAGHHIIVQALAHHAQARHGANGDLGNVANQNGRAVARSHHDVADVIGRSQQANTANGVLLHALSHVAATRVGVTAPQRVQQVLKRQLVGAQLVQIGLHFIQFGKAAHGHHVGNAGHLAQGALDHPVFQRAQLGGGFAIPLHAVAHDLAHGRGIGRDVGGHALRQVNAAQAFIDLLACLLHLGVVVIGDHGEGQAELRVREDADGIRQARQGDLNRQRDLLFYLFSGAAREQRDHGHLGVGHIRKGLNRQVLEGDHARHHKQQRPQDDEQGLVQGVLDQAFHL